MQVATSAASARRHIPRTFALGHLPLHDRVQILQPRRTDERLVAHIDVVGYGVVAEVDRIGERLQPVRKVALVARHFTIAVCVSELSMHTRVKAKALGEQLRVRL
jgi:hypothetical protein